MYLIFERVEYREKVILIKKFYSELFFSNSIDFPAIERVVLSSHGGDLDSPEDTPELSRFFHIPSI